MRKSEIFFSERCCLQTTKEEDLEELIELYTDPISRKYLGGPISKDVALRRILKCCENRNVPIFWKKYYTVSLRENNQIIGLVSITQHHSFFRKEISYQFRPAYWGNGYACESIAELLKEYKKKRNSKQLVAETQSKNDMSRHLLEKLGFIEEKRLFRFGEEQVLYVKNIY